MVPVIRILIKHGHTVIIGADKAPLAFLLQEFPGLEWIVLPGAAITYGKKRMTAWNIILRMPALIRSKQKEHRLLAELVSEKAPDMVISDNRYGLWNEQITSVIITHQLMLKLPGILKILEYPVHRLIKKMIQRFDHCLIPDYPGNPNLTGDLAHKYPLPANADFIGPLSRFDKIAVQNPPDIDLLILISGPEPQRSKAETLLLRAVENFNGSVVLLQGLPGVKNTVKRGNITIYNHLPSAEINDLINRSQHIIARSGYSTIMDLICLKKNAILIPTPGQTEQEYLAEYLGNNQYFTFLKQMDIQPEKLSAENSRGFIPKDFPDTEAGIKAITTNSMSHTVPPKTA